MREGEREKALENGDNRDINENENVENNDRRRHDNRQMLLRKQQQQEISCDLTSKMLHEMLPIILGTSMRNKRERDEIDCGRGYIANSLGQRGNINCNVAFDSFR